MKVLYSAPNKSHHYIYAKALYDANVLSKFLSGYPRFSSHSKIDIDPTLIYRADILQSIYIASLKAHLSNKISSELAYLSKIEQDKKAKKFLKDADIFLFYSGSGLESSRLAKKLGKISIVEAVNSHVNYQESILKQEYLELGLPWRPFHKREKERRITEYEEADYILMPSNFVKRSFLLAGFPENKLLKVPYGVKKLDTLDKTENLRNENNSEDFKVLFVGTISVRKGIRYLLEAFKMLKHKKKKLILVGPVGDEALLSLISKTENVEYKGVLKGRKLLEEYQNADVFCLPSIEEGLALVIGEALSAGLPVIATFNTGAGELITEGAQGFLVEIKNAFAISEKLNLLADNPKLLEKLKASAKQTFYYKNGWDFSGKLLLNTLQSTLK